MAVAGQTYRSTVSLRLTADLIANGVVRSDAHGCEARREVLIQSRVGGNWRIVETDRTRSTGTYRVHIPPVSGTYRAVIRKLEIASGTCTRDVSPSDRYAGSGGDGDGPGNCTPGYDRCLVYRGGADDDCAGGSGDGPYYTAPGVPDRVTGSDPYGLDADNDGYGCE